MGGTATTPQQPDWRQKYASMFANYGQEQPTPEQQSQAALFGGPPALFGPPSATSTAAAPPTAAPVAAPASSAAAAPVTPATSVAGSIQPPLPDEKTWEEQGGRGVIPNRPTIESDQWGAGKKIGMGIARLFGLSDVIAPGEDQRLAEEHMAQHLFDRNQPELQKEANWQEYQREEAARGASLGQALEQQNLTMPPAKREFLGQFAAEVQSGQVDPQQAFNKYLAMGRYVPGGVTADDLNGVLNNTPVKPPVFGVKDKTIEPLMYKGHVYGTTPEPGEPQEVTDARQQAESSLAYANRASQDPAITAQLGEEPPAGGVNAKGLTREQWGKQALAMEIRKSAAPRIEAIQARPVQVGGENGTVTYDTAGNAIAAHAQAPGSAPVATAKKTSEAFAVGPQGQQLTAIDTAREHMKTFGQLADALDNGNVQLINKLGNKLGVQFGNDKTTNFNIAKQAFAGEVGKALAGAGVTEGDRKEVEQSFNAAMSPAQLKGVIQTTDALLQGKQNALGRTRAAGMSGGANFGGENSQPQPKRGAISQGAGQTRIATPAMIRGYAAKHGLSYNDAAQQAAKEGWKVQQ